MTTKADEQNIFDEIAPYYDKMNNLISFFTHKQIKKSAVKLLTVKENSNILDICTGTGDIIKILNKIAPNSKITGIDKSSKMLDIARKKKLNAKLVEGDATKLDFSDETFDIVTSTFGLRNIENRKQALCEIYRVLKTGGEFLHLDFSNKNILNKIFDIITPITTLNSDKYIYLIKSKNNYPNADKIIEEFESVGFKLKSKKYYFLKALCAQIMIK